MEACSGIHPDSSHFTPFPYATGACLDAAPVVFPRVGAFVFPDCVGPLNGFSQEISSFFCCPNPRWFLQPEVMRLYIKGAETLGFVIWPGTGIAHSQGAPVILPTTGECGTTHSDGYHRLATTLHLSTMAPCLCPSSPSG